MNKISGVLSDFDDRFQRNYNKASFTFAHRLSGNPLFELANLTDFGRQVPDDPNLVFWSNGKVSVDDRWEAKVGPRYTLQESIANIAENNSLVMLKRLELDPNFGPLVREIIENILSAVGPAMRDDIIIGRGTLLIASPQRITSYHMDGDTNFLMQITGDKLFRVFDQNDRTLTSDVERERYFAGDMNGAIFKESRQRDAHTYDLKAGLGVHVPCLAPHWTQNGSSLSVALSVNFDLRSATRVARIYKMNHQLRNLGIRPTPPGISAWRDHIKFISERGLAATRKILRG
jgi:hypothetical protein